MHMPQRRFTFFVLIVLLHCTRFAHTQSASALPQPVTTLYLSECLPEEPGKLNSVAFSSNDSIAMWIYRTSTGGPQYSQYDVRWSSGSFKRIAQPDNPRWGGRSSADGSRMLFDSGERNVPKFQRLVE